MEAYFDKFIETMGQPMATQTVPDSAISQYRGQLPDQLLTYWRQHGWSRYAQGLFWTVNPKTYEPVLEAWLGQTRIAKEDDYHVIARGAFGDLYGFGARHGRVLHLIASEAELLPPSLAIADVNLAIRAFFASREKASSDLWDDEGEPLFERALAQLGALDADEMYGFEPALALGGPCRLANLKKVSAVEHLVLLAQLGDLTLA